MKKYKIPLFELSISTVFDGDVAIINNRTGTFANTSLKPLKEIKKEFKIFLRDKKVFAFSNMESHQIEKLKSLLPKTNLYI